MTRPLWLRCPGLPDAGGCGVLFISDGCYLCSVCSRLETETGLVPLWEG